MEMVMIITISKVMVHPHLTVVMVTGDMVCL